MSSLAHFRNRGSAIVPQYENNEPPAPGSTPATAFPLRARESAVSITPSPQLPAENIVDIISNLLIGRGRAEADAIMVAAVDRLDSTFSIPGPAQHGPEVPHTTADRADLSAALSLWRERAAQRRKLHQLAASFRSSRALSEPSEPEPLVTKFSTLADRDAALRADAVSLRSSSPSIISSPSISSSHLSSSLPFIEPSDLPPALVAHKDHGIITRLLASRPDRTLVRWRRRALYTAENWAEWAEWSPSSKTHRNALDSGAIFLDARIILQAPDLRSADVEVAADAWNNYRRHLLILIRQALCVGFSWIETLARLSATFAHPTQGYPRLANYLTAALDDAALLSYPLLHSDVLFYKLDASYAHGSRSYSAESNTIDWELAVSRLPGEDAVSLAIRVTSAFLMKHDDPKLTDVTVWEHPAFVAEINNRYADCLLNDPDDPERGRSNSAAFHKYWHQVRARRSLDGVEPALHLSCEYLSKIAVLPNEARLCSLALPAPESDPEHADCARPLPRLTHNTGAGSRARRDASLPRRRHRRRIL